MIEGISGNSEFWTILPNWISLVILLALAIITWWYARSTRDMARIMKETYEAETSPQLGCAIENIVRMPRLPTDLEISFQLKFTNAGKYALGIKSISLVGEVLRGGISSPLIQPLDVEAVLIAPTRDYSVPGRTIIRSDVRNLKIKVDFEDFKGRSHSKEFPFPQ